MFKSCKKYRRMLSCLLLVVGLVSTMSLGMFSEAAYGDTVTWKPVPEIYSDSCILIDGDTGEVIFEHNSHDVKYPASITKICTAGIILENHALTETVTLQGEALQKLPEGYVSMFPKDGEELSVEDMMYALLMYSANDAGNGLAVFDAGSIAAFAEKMNEYAAKAGACDTHFTNPSGLFEEEHTTTAYDMAMIMKECIKYEDFVRISSDLTHTIEGTNKSGARLMSSHVQPIIPTSVYYIPEVISGKTGFTTPSRYTMVTAAKKDGRTLICAVMNCASEDARCVTTRRLFDYGFAYEKVKPELADLAALTPVAEEEGLVQMISHPNFHGQLMASDSFMIPVGSNLSDLEVLVEAREPDALSEGEMPGGIEVTYHFSHDGEELGSAQVLYCPDYQIDLSKDAPFQFAGWKLAWAGLLLLIFFVILLRSINWKKKKVAPVLPHTEVAAPEDKKVEESAEGHTSRHAEENKPVEQNAKTAALIEELKEFLEEASRSKDSQPEAVVKAQVISQESDQDELEPEDLEKSGESKDEILAQVKELLKETEDETGSKASKTEE